MTAMRNLNLSYMGCLLSLLVPLAIACGSDDGVDSDEEARRAYLGLDLSIDKAINLGMDGYNAASNANIPDQLTDGDVSGTLTVGGKVDAGESSNKTMNLDVFMVAYSDGPAVRVDDDDIDITYDTDPAAAPLLSIKLANLPNGTFNGSLNGRFAMTGDLEGTVELQLSFAGDIEEKEGGGIQRVVGTTTVTGVALTDDDGTYEVALEI
jgi:hypothetical protein